MTFDLIKKELFSRERERKKDIINYYIQHETYFYATYMRVLFGQNPIFGCLNPFLRRLNSSSLKLKQESLLCVYILGSLCL